MQYDINIYGKVYRINLKKAPVPEHPDRWTCRLDNRELIVDAIQLGPNALSIVLNGKSFEVRRESLTEGQRIFIGGSQYDVALQDTRSLKTKKRAAEDTAGPLKLTAAMPGKVVRVLANEGDTLKAGMGIVVVEAMKMQNELRSPKDGRLKQLLAREGMNVNAGDVLAVLE